MSGSSTVEVKVKVEARSRLARIIATTCVALWPLVGRQRANRWGVAALLRFSRFRIGGGRWQRFDWREFCGDSR